MVIVNQQQNTRVERQARMSTLILLRGEIPYKPLVPDANGWWQELSVTMDEKAGLGRISQRYRKNCFRNDSRVMGMQACPLGTGN